MEFSSGLRQVEGQPVSRSDIDASYIPEPQCQQEKREKQNGAFITLNPTS